MEVELQSDWQDTQVELLKALHGFELADVNDEIGSVDYVTVKDGEPKVLLRVIVDQDFYASKANLDLATKTLETLEDREYDEAVIVAENFTRASKKLVRDENKLEYITPSSESYSLFELIEAIQNQTWELCKIRCGAFPTSSEDCKGYENGEYTCHVRRISDDADFHAERGWQKLLMKDFSKLVDLRRKMSR